MKLNTIKIFLLIFLLSTLSIFPKSKFISIYINSQKFLAEIADTDKLITKGLMFRKYISKTYSMLFIFKNEEPRAFWMKNTLIYLDIIFLNKNREIINIHHNVPPCKGTPCHSYYSEKPAKYVVEIQGNLSKKMSLKKGDTIEFLL